MIPPVGPQRDVLIEEWRIGEKLDWWTKWHCEGDWIREADFVRHYSTDDAAALTLAKEVAGKEDSDWGINILIYPSGCSSKFAVSAKNIEDDRFFMAGSDSLADCVTQVVCQIASEQASKGGEG